MTSTHTQLSSAGSPQVQTLLPKQKGKRMRWEGGREGQQALRSFSESGHIFRHWDVNMNMKKSLPSRMYNSIENNQKKKNAVQQKGFERLEQLTIIETIPPLHTEKDV